MNLSQKIKKFVLGLDTPLQQNIVEKIPLPGLLLKVVGHTFIIENATDDYCILTSTSREYIVGKQVPEAFPNEEESWRQLETSFKNVIHTKEPDQMEIFRYDIIDPVKGRKQERYWQAHNFPLIDPETNEAAFVWNLVIDKTSEVLFENHLKETESERSFRKEQNQVFIKENSDGLFSLNTMGRFLTVNEGLVQIAETPEEELIRMDFLPFCAEHDRERIYEIFQMALQGTPQTFEADFVSGKGTKVILSVDLLPMKIEGDIKGVYGIAKDISVLRTSEKNLNQKTMFLDLYSRIIDFIVAYGVETVNLEYIFAQIGFVTGIDRVYYLGQALNDLEGKTLISDNIQWYRKSADIHAGKQSLWWLNRLVENFGPFYYDTPVTIEERHCDTIEQKELLSHIGKGTLLVLPLFVKEDFLGIVGIEKQDSGKIWQQEEQEFLRSLLKNVVGFVEKKITDLEVERKERELERTEKKFEFLVQEGSDIIGILEADGTYKFVSASSMRILNIPCEYFIGRNAFDFIHPEDKDFVFAQFSSIANQRQITMPPFRFRDGSGNWRWVETTATNLLSAPQVEGIVTNSRDVTEEVERTNEIRELNERYRLATSATSDLIYDWDLATDEIIRYFEGKEKMFGFSLEKMKERNFWKEHIHPEDLQRLMKHLDDTLTNPNAKVINTQYRFRRSNGTYAHIIDRAHIVRDAHAKPLKLIGATSDISEITSSKNALKLANIRFNYAMKATREMMWDWNIQEDTILRSKAFKKIYGFDESLRPSVENSWFNKISTKERKSVKDSLFAALEDPKVSKWKNEYRLIKENGEKTYVVDRGYIVRNKTGKAVRMVGATLDVSESRRLIKEIKKQNIILKDIAWEQAHVVRGPLTRLTGLTELLKQKIYDEWNQEELVDLINKSAEELDDIVIKIIRKTEEI